MRTKRPNIPNILTFDIEESYHLNYSSMTKVPDQFLTSQVRANTEKLLSICAQYKAKATFFFLGSVAEKYPDLVRRTFAEGHEVASHGYNHKLVYQQTPAEFHEDVKKSLNILQNITGEAVKGYRAPSWSISQKTPWAYDVLIDLGLIYDASLFPFKTFLYGDNHASTIPFLMHNHQNKLVEVPATALNLFGQRFPFGGGFYFRIMPYWLTRLATHIINRQERSVVFYLHPREIDQKQTRIPLPLRDYFITYVNISGTAHKLKKVLSLAPTVSIHNHLELTGLIDVEKSEITGETRR
jgi:peptidoglycan-N-acetylglucosamine deacetylase